jgi:hypothetical protein
MRRAAGFQGAALAQLLQRTIDTGGGASRSRTQSQVSTARSSGRWRRLERLDRPADPRPYKPLLVITPVEHHDIWCVANLLIRERVR